MEFCKDFVGYSDTDDDNVEYIEPIEDDGQEGED